MEDHVLYHKIKLPLLKLIPLASIDSIFHIGGFTTSDVNAKELKALAAENKILDLVHKHQPDIRQDCYEVYAVQLKNKAIRVLIWLDPFDAFADGWFLEFATSEINLSQLAALDVERIY